VAPRKKKKKIMKNIKILEYKIKQRKRKVEIDDIFMPDA